MKRKYKLLEIVINDELIYGIELSTAEDSDMAELYIRYIDDTARDRKLSVVYHKLPGSKNNTEQSQQNMVKAIKWFYQMLGQQKIRRN